jgi:methyl-accepting chemotaxis protein
VKKKLISFLLIISILPLLILSAYLYHLIDRTISSNFEELSETQATAIASDISNLIETNMITVRQFAVNPVVQSMNPEAIVPMLEAVNKTMPDVSSIIVNKPDGWQLARSDKAKLIDISKRPYYNEILAGKTEVISEVTVSSTSGKFIVLLVTPIKMDNKVVGSVQLAVHLDKLSAFVEKLSKNSRTAFVVDREGKMLAHPDKKLTTERTDMNGVAFVQQALKGVSGRAEYAGKDGVKKLVRYQREEKTGWAICLEVPQEVLDSKQNSIKYIVITSLIVLILIVLILGRFIANRITKPIISMVSASNRIIDGDLRNTANISATDEVGILAKNFNTMAENLRGLIKQIHISAEKVASSSEELTASAEQSADASGSIAGSIQQVANGSEKQVLAVNDTSTIVEEISATMDRVSTTAVEMATLSEQTFKVAADGKVSVERAVAQMGAVSTGAKQAQAAAEALKTSSAQIGEIVGLISTIAGQTNLLALNAAIEAARAGEQGRGFAVVAEEVRKLAEQSETAAHQIKALVEENHNSIGNVVGAIDLAINDITQGVELVNVAGTNFGAINGQVRQVTDQVAVIAKAINEAAVGSRRIVSSIKEVEHLSRDAAAEAQTVSAATEEQSASMEEIAASSQTLAKLAMDLQVAVAKFRV